jgi:hypothetical protein
VADFLTAGLAAAPVQSRRSASDGFNNAARQESVAPPSAASASTSVIADDGPPFDD